MTTGHLCRMREGDVNEGQSPPGTRAGHAGADVRVWFAAAVSTRGGLPAAGQETNRWALAVCAVASVVVLPGGLNAFTLPKLAVASAGVTLALWSPGPGRRTWPRPVWLALAVGAVAVVIGTVAGAVTSGSGPGFYGSLVGPAPRYPGLVSVVPYLGLALAGARLLGVPGKQTRGLVPVLAGCAGVVALVSVLEQAGFRPLESDVSRPGSLLGNASDAGQWGVLALGPLLAWAVARRGAVRQGGRVVGIAVGGSGLAAVVVALSGSRAALLGELAVGATLAVLVSGRRWVAPAAALVLAGLALLVPSVASRVTGSSPLAQQTAHGRTLLWRESLQLAAAHPFGTGPGGFTDAITAEHDRAWALAVGPGTPVSSPESWPLELLAVGGPLLLLAGLAFAGLTALAGWRRRHDPVLAGLAAGLVGYAVSAAFAAVSTGPAVLAAIFGGALLAQPPPVPSLSGKRKAASFSGWGFGVLAVVLGLAAVAEVPLRSGVLAVGRRESTEAFGVAHLLRPWDPTNRLVEGHAYAAVAATGDQAAAARCLGLVDGRSFAQQADRASCEEVRGNLDGSAQLLTRVSGQDPTNALLLLRLGVVEAERHRYPQAEQLFTSAAQLTPTSPDPWRDLAQLYGLTGDIVKQEQALAEAHRRS